jgi:hypothetical protein
MLEKSGQIQKVVACDVALAISICTGAKIAVSGNAGKGERGSCRRWRAHPGFLQG